ncbi:MAG: zinc-ribbon domain-containing protein [Promethearchaeota archaeon]
MSKFQEVQCPYCGRMVRSNDKFCIFCGSKMQKSEPSVTYSKEERDELDKELGGKTETDSKSTKLPEFQVTEESPDDDKKNKKKSKKTTKVELPQNIVDQLEAKMNLAFIEKRKVKLKDKLQDLKGDLDSNRYENDYEYADKITAKLSAFKAVKEELLKNEEEIRSVLGPKGQFRMDELEDEMEIQREQLIELKRQYKRHKIKKDIYEQLKMEYSSDYRELEDELQELRNNIIIWLSKEKSEKKRIDNKIRMLRARYKSREIDETEYTQQKATMEKKIEKMKERVSILENYSNPRNSKWI